MARRVGLVLRRAALVRAVVTVGFLTLGGCVADAMNPAGFQLVVLGATDTGDSVWTASPGDDRLIQVRLLSLAGEPIAGATLVWVPEGTGSSIATDAVVSDDDGYASARWRIGTDASERQSLRVAARHARTSVEAVVPGRVVPSVVASLQLAGETPLVLRVGDTLAAAVRAVDPFGNVFAAPDLSWTIGDSAVIHAIDGVLVGGVRRGSTVVTARSAGRELPIAVRVVQVVARIEPHSDTLWFSSLGAEQPVEYVVVDDRGRLVADTSVVVSVEDTTVVQLNGSQVRSLRTGITALELAIGSTVRRMMVGIQQRVASLDLAIDTIRFDALLDTVTLRPVAHDSMGALIPHPALVYRVANAAVASVLTGGTVLAVTEGTSLVTAEDPTTRVAAQAAIVVHQRTVTIEIAAVSFDALTDTQTVAASARDRLGSIVGGAVLTYTTTDDAVATVTPGGLVRSTGQGRARIAVREAEFSVAATTDVTVSQRAVRLALAADTVTTDALGDTIALTFTAWDRLGAAIANAAVSYASDDAAILEIGSDGLVRSRDNGTTALVLRSADGPADTAVVHVAQRVRRVVPERDSLLLEALGAVQAVSVTALDRLDAPVRSALFLYSVTDSTTAAIDAAGQVTARTNGRTSVLVQSADAMAAVPVAVVQRPFAVTLGTDTLRFGALGDTYAIAAVTVDSLGSAIADAALVLESSDTTVVSTAAVLTLRATGNGVATARVSAGTATAATVVLVDQVVTSLNVTIGEPIVTRSAGELLPLQCDARDRNGYRVARDPQLVGSARGTVGGGSCAEARVQRSGYDTLVFALDPMQVRVPVVVSLGDSIDVRGAAQPLSLDKTQRFVGEDLNKPAIIALRPLVAEIMAAYGNPIANLDRARALRDWVARMAIHPDPSLHPDTSSANLSVLPEGATWADVNLMRWKEADDNLYWSSMYFDGYYMLDRLLGTLDPVSGLRADDGMMERVGPARYRIRDVATYRYVLCSYQAIMLNALWAAAGLHGMRLAILGHDPAAVFIPELGKWIYEDPTYNEEYRLEGGQGPLSPGEILAVSSAGQSWRLRPTKLWTASVDDYAYITRSYLDAGHPEGMIVMGGQLYQRAVGARAAWTARYVQIDVPALATVPLPWSNPAAYVPVPETNAFPVLGVVIQERSLQDSVYVVRLASTFPNHARYERRLSGGAWELSAETDVLPVGACRVEYRSLDAMGNSSAAVALDVWAPRIGSFVTAAAPGSLRARATLCVEDRGP